MVSFESATNEIKKPTISKKIATGATIGGIAIGGIAGKAIANKEVPILEADSKKPVEYIETQPRPTVSKQIEQITGGEIDETTLPSYMKIPKGYKLDPRGSNSFVPAGGRPVDEAMSTDQRDVDTTIAEIAEKGITEYGAPAPSDEISSNTPPQDKKPVPIFSDTKKRKSSTEANETSPSKETKQPTQENQKDYTPSKKSDSYGPTTLVEQETTPNPEQAQKLVEKAITTLHDLTNKLPDILTSKNLTSLLALTTTALSHNADAQAQQCKNVAANLLPDNIYSQQISDNVQK